MSIKIIATDLDGTLMSPDHITITNRTKSALVKAHNKGIKIAISTGRTLSLIDDVKNQIPFVDYIIYSNGAAVYDCEKDRLIFNSTIPREKSERLISLLDSMPIFFNAYIDGKIYMKKENEDFRDMSDMPSEFLDRFLEICYSCDDIKAFTKGKGAEVVVGYFLSDDDRNRLSHLIDELQGLQKVTSVMNNIEIMSEDAGKGNALKAICENIGCSPDEVMCFGDAGNDCSMLEYAGMSFAMANCDEECKKSAKFMTASNAEDGVAVAIEKFILN